MGFGAFDSVAQALAFQLKAPSRGKPPDEHAGWLFHSEEWAQQGNALQAQWFTGPTLLEWDILYLGREARRVTASTLQQLNQTGDVYTWTRLNEYVNMGTEQSHCDDCDSLL